MLSKSLIQFSLDGWGWVFSLLFDLRPNYSGGNEDNGDLLQKAPRMHCCIQCPQPLDVGYLFLVGSNILQSMVVQQRGVVLELSQEMSAHPSTLPFSRLGNSRCCSRDQEQLHSEVALFPLSLSGGVGK